MNAVQLLLIIAYGIGSFILGAAFCAVHFWKDLKERITVISGQLESEQRKVAMIHAARSEASRKGWQTKARRIHLPDGQS